MDEKCNPAIYNCDKQSPLQNLNEQEIVKRSNVQTIEKDADDDKQNPDNVESEMKNATGVVDMITNVVDNATCSSDANQLLTTSVDDNSTSSNIDENMNNSQILTDNRTGNLEPTSSEESHNSNETCLNSAKSDQDKASRAAEKNDDVVQETEKNDVILEDVKKEPINTDYEIASGVYRTTAPVAVVDSSDSSSSSSEDEGPAPSFSDDSDDEETVNPNDSEEVR